MSGASSSLVDGVQQLRVQDEVAAGVPPGGAPVKQLESQAQPQPPPSSPLIGAPSLDVPELNEHWAGVLGALLQPVPPAGRAALFHTDAGAAAAPADAEEAEAGAKAEGAPDQPVAAAAASPSLADMFVDALPADVQRWWRGCRLCERFMERYGGLAVLRDDPLPEAEVEAPGAETAQAAGGDASAAGEAGAADKQKKRPPMRLIPLLWSVDPAPDSAAARFAPAFRAMRALFTPHTKITGVFVPVANQQPGAGEDQAGCTIGLALTTAQPRPAAAVASGAAGVEGAPSSSSDAGAAAAAAAAASCRQFPHMNFTFPLSCCQPASARHGHDTLRDMLQRTLEQNPLEHIREAHRLLTEDKLNYADQHKPAISMLNALAQRGADADDAQRDLLLWHCAAACHPGQISSVRSGAVSTLLAELCAETPMNILQSRWNTLVGPESYMRATVAPSAGAIAAAERLFKEMGLSAADLERRYLRRDELPQGVALFQDEEVAKGQPAAPAAVPVPATTDASASSDKSAEGKKKAVKGGVFAHLAPKNKDGAAAAASAAAPAAKAAAAPPTKQMTFLQFVRTTLPRVRRVEARVPADFSPVFFITGNAGTAPLMQWHTATNLVSQYTYSGAAPAAHWGLEAGAWTRVHTILPFAHQWPKAPPAAANAAAAAPAAAAEGEKEGGNGGAAGAAGAGAPSPQENHSFSHHGRKYLIALCGVRDGHPVPGPSLFPAYLASAFHPVRSVFEAHNNSAKIQGTEYLERSGVAGLFVDVGNKPSPQTRLVLRATHTDGSVALYDLACEGEGDGQAVPQQPDAAAP